MLLSGLPPPTQPPHTSFASGVFLVNSFSEFMQNKIAEGKNVEFVIKEIPAFTVVMSRIVALLPTIMFMILIYLKKKQM